VKTPEGICPSCRRKLGPTHAASHARYAERHALAVRKLQRKYAEKEEQCRYCGGKIENYAGVCNRCALFNRKNKRERNGFGKWKPGMGGRKPYVKERE